MKKVRLIARLDIKGPNLIKGVHLEGLRVVGSPNEYAVRYYEQGADELIYMDSVASLYARNHLGEIIKAAAKDIFIPMTVGGGIRSIDDATEILRSGADKVAINTAAVADVGIPNVNNGINTPAAAALFAASGPATPSIAPLPNSSLFFDNAFSTP